MILSSHQSGYFPYLGYFQKLDAADIFIVMDSVDYSSGDFISRNRIKTKDGTQMLSVPCSHHAGEKIKDVRISNQIWRKKHLKSIKQNYSKAPHFQRYESWLEKLYAIEWTKISDLNWHILKAIVAELEIDTKIIRMSDHEFSGQKSELILDMCLQLNCDHFIFGANGKDYAQPKLFYDAGVSISFQEYQHPIYSQLHGDFIPNMCILDLLMCKGGDSLDVIRGKE